MSSGVTRRDLGKLALAALPATCLPAKTNSRFGGVPIGINAPYSFHGQYNSGDQCLEAIVKLNLSSVELRAQPIEQFMGARPELVAYPPVRRAGNRGGQKQGESSGASEVERAAARKTDAEELRKWRLAASMDKVKAFRRKYEDAGVRIEIVKVDAIDTFPTRKSTTCSASPRRLARTRSPAKSL